MSEIQNYPNFLIQPNKAQFFSSLSRVSSVHDEDYDMRKTLPDFYSIFPYIKRYIDLFIFKDLPAKTNYTRHPMVKIKKIAKKLGIKKIVEISFKNIYDVFKKDHIDMDIKDIKNIFFNPKRAILAYKEAIIFVDKYDRMEEKLFSIAHEIFHFIFLTEQNKNMSVIAKKKARWTKQIETSLNYRQHTNQSDNADLAKHFAARDNKKAEREMKTISRYISQGQVITFITNDVLKKNISDIVEDEIADYFAANLLVPVERFILWDDKTDKEIARAFGTVEGCIQKRRIEIKEELEIMKPKKLSSGVNLEKFAQSSYETITMTNAPGGNDIYEAKIV